MIPEQNSEVWSMHQEEKNELKQVGLSNFYVRIE